MVSLIDVDAPETAGSVMSAPLRCTRSLEIDMFEWFANSTVRTARRVIVGIIGATVVLTGVAMLVLPGPGLAVIGAGLAFLSLEFAFAQRWLRIVRERSQQAADQARIPKSIRGALVVGGVLLGVVMMIIPGCVVVVRTPGGVQIVQRDGFSYAHAWTSADRLERAAAKGDQGAVRLLESVQPRRDSAPPEEHSP